MIIQIDDLRGLEIKQLLLEHLEQMHANTPPGNIHALNPEQLRSPEITFWTAWEDGELLGCGALKALNASEGEIKSMCTAVAHRRKGVARRMLEHIIGEAHRRGYLRLYLETGSLPAFEPARQLSRYGSCIIQRVLLFAHHLPTILKIPTACICVGCCDPSSFLFYGPRRTSWFYFFIKRL